MLAITGKFIPYAYLPTAHATPGTPLEVEYFAQRISATVNADPMFDAKIARLKA